MNNGRKRKWMTLEKFQEFLNNDFSHLKQKVELNSKLLWIILGALIVASLIDRLFGG